jgi:hypothetical protein
VAEQERLVDMVQLIDVYVVEFGLVVVVGKFDTYEVSIVVEFYL